jgi:hypothetical protein
MSHLNLPGVDLAHVDLAGSEQSPEQHGGSISWFTFLLQSSEQRRVKWAAV